MRIAVITLSLALLMSAVVPAASQSRRELDDGALIDHTLTVGGHEFFQQFSMLWRAQPLNERYTLAIHELPSPRRGTLVWIEYDRGRVFQAYLPASRIKLVELVREANERCYENVVDAEVRKLIFREPDLAADEI